MGMNSGIHDVRSLADHSVLVLEGEDAALLERYDRRRRTIALEEAQRLSAQIYARHRKSQADKRQVIWQAIQDTVNDPIKHRDYLPNAAMIRSREREQTIE